MTILEHLTSPTAFFVTCVIAAVLIWLAFRGVRL